MSDHTVRSVKDRERISIAHVKKTVLSNITHGLRLASERVIELMPEASARDALIGVGILGEKMQLLGGDATSRIDISISNGRSIYDELREFGEKALKIIEADVVPQTVLNGGNAEQKALQLVSGASTNGDRAPSAGELQEALP